MERRRHPRKPLVRNALLYHPLGHSYPCRIENASSDGLFLRATDARIYKGNWVDVAIDVSPSMTKTITAQALVVHKKHDGIGLLCESSIPLHDLFENLQQPGGTALGMMARWMGLGDAHWQQLQKYFPKKAL